MHALSLPAEALNKSTIEKRKEKLLKFNSVPTNNFPFCQDRCIFNSLSEAALSLEMAIGI